MSSKRSVTCPNCGFRFEVYRNPFPTVDIIIEVEGGIVLIERRNPPKGCAIPGGFVDWGESVEEAAVREAMEETGLQVELVDLLYVYSDPSRDPRFHTISTVFVAKAHGVPVGGDDAKVARVFSLDEIPFSELAFDHAKILKDYIRYRKEGLKPKPFER